PPGGRPRSYHAGAEKFRRKEPAAGGDPRGRGSLQLDRPVGVFQEGAPGLVLLVGQFQVEHRAALGLLRLVNEVHVRLLRRPAALLDVAGHAGADDVLPGARAPLAAGHHVVEAQLAGRELLAAVLALVVVAGEDVPPVELHRLLGEPVVAHQPDDARHLDLAADGPDPVVVLLPEVAGAGVAGLAPGGGNAGGEPG